MKSLYSKPTSDPYSYAIGKKPDPYAYALTSKTTAPISKAKQSSPKKLSAPTNFEVEKIGINYKPPTILIQYRDNDSDKLYHHKIVMKKLTKQTLTSDALSYLKKKHAPYMKKLDQQQISGLVNKLKIKLGGTANMVAKKQNQPIDQQYDNDDEEDEDDFDYLQNSDELSDYQQ